MADDAVADDAVAAEATTRKTARGSASGVVPTPHDVRAERGAEDRSITISWTAESAPDVEYKITRLAQDGSWRVVGRTRSTSIVDGGVAADAAVPVYEVIARRGSTVSDQARSSALPGAPPPPTAPGGIPAVQHLAVSGAGTLTFAWPPGITEAMVVVRHDQPPAAPNDPAATAWKITNMRYQLDGGLVLPTSVALPCHVAVASCRREGGALVVAPAFGPTARAVFVGATGP